MRCFAALAFALLIPVVALAADADKGQAIEAAKSWVGLVDAGGYAQSWKSASPLFQSHVTEAQWAAAAKATRDPLGPVVTRNVAGADFAATLPGAPDGQYAVVTFDTKFANKAAAVETVALARDRGSWKAAGYYVR